MRYFGPAVWHYFVIPFTIPNLFRRLFGEGALSVAVIPVYTELRNRDARAAGALVRSVITMVVMILAVLTLLGEGVIYVYGRIAEQQFESDVSLALAAIMLPYMILICLVAVVGAFLNVHRHFAAPAAAPIILNLCIIAAVVYFRRFFGDDPWRQIYAVAIAVLIAGFLQLLLQYPALRRAGISLRPLFSFSDPGLTKIMRLMAPMIVGLAAVQINTMFDSLVAFFLSATAESGPTFTLMGRTFQYPVIEKSVSDLYCAQRLYQFPLGVFGIALATAIFPHLSSYAARKDLAAFSQTLGQGVRLALFISLPATVGMILIRLPLSRAIFEGGEFGVEDSHRVAGTLLFYALGIGAYFLQHLVVRAFYSFEDSATPVKVALRMIALNLALNLLLIWPLGTGGLALSTAICAVVQVGILLSLLIKRYQLNITEGIRSSLAKTLAATLVMTVGCQGLDHVLGPRGPLIQLIQLLLVGAGLYGGASWLLRNPELQVLLRRK